MKPLVSVIIPTFNRAEYIGLAIQSVLSQTYSNLEIIIIDDGSTDATREIVTAIQDARIRYIYTTNRGNYFARNVGLKEARGEFIAFLDSDDQFLPQKLSVQLQCFDRDPNLGLCCCNAHIKDRSLPGKVFQDAAHSFAFDFDTHNGFIERLIQNNFIFTSSVMIRKRCINTLGDFDTAYQNAMDYDFFLRIAMNVKAIYLKEKLVEKFVHTLNISSNKLNTQRAVIYLLDKALQQGEKWVFFRPEFKNQILSARQEDMYYLGLECLIQYDFASAYRYIHESGYQKKHIFKNIALGIAKHRLFALIPFVAFYRHFRQRQSLHSSIA